MLAYEAIEQSRQCKRRFVKSGHCISMRLKKDGILSIAAACIEHSSIPTELANTPHQSPWFPRPENMFRRMSIKKVVARFIPRRSHYGNGKGTRHLTASVKSCRLAKTYGRFNLGCEVNENVIRNSAFW